MQDIASDDGLTYFPGQFKEQEEPWEIRDWLANAKEACPDSPEVSEATGSNPHEPEAQQPQSKPNVAGLSSKEKRRIWNRENARRSRERRKVMVNGMLDRLERLQKENHFLKAYLHSHNLLSLWHHQLQEQGKEPVDTSSIDIEKLKAEMLPQKKSECIHLGRSSGSKRSAPETSSSHVIKQARTATSTGGFVLDYDDFTLMENVHVGQQHFLITDPWMHDNPIVFASGGFYELTGYTPSEVLGRNCRFMQGKDSDPEAIKEIHEGIDKGEDVHCIVRNYKKDGTPFWNDLFIAPLRGEDGSVVHFLGVQCAISEERATRLLDAKARISGCSP